MSLIRSFYTYIILPSAVIGTVWGTRRLLKYQASSAVKWDLKNPLQNLKNMAQAKPEEIAPRIAPLHLFNMSPLISQGFLGVENKKEAETSVNTCKDIAGLGVGLVVATIPVIRFFHGCLDHASVGVCAKTSVEDLFSYSAVPLLAGAYLVSQVAKVFIINPLFTNFARDPNQKIRFQFLSLEYTKMLTLLNIILDKPSDDPEFKKIVPIVEQFLRISPIIENELHSALSFDRDQAKELLIPLQTACRQILVKYSHAITIEKIKKEEEAEKILEAARILAEAAKLEESKKPVEAEKK